MSKYGQALRHAVKGTPPRDTPPRRKRRAKSRHRAALEKFARAHRG